MKKYWIGAAALLLASGLTLSGCGNDSGRETGKIHAVTHANWKPFEYMKDGKITGFDAVFLEEAAKRAGLSAELGDAGWEALFEQIRSHQADLAISGITITKEREASYLFSKPYFISRQAILTRPDKDIRSAEDLKRSDIEAIAVQNGSTGQEALEKLLGKNAPVIKKTPMSIQMLIGGQADAIVGDETSLKSIQAQYPDQHLVIVYDDQAFKPEYFGILYAKDNTALKEKLDKGISSMVEDGTYSRLYEEWFKTKPDEKVLASLKK